MLGRTRAGLEDVNSGASNIDKAVEDDVLAADGLRVARASDSDTAAGDTEDDGRKYVSDETQEGEDDATVMGGVDEGGNLAVRPNVVAALDVGGRGAGAAAAAGASDHGGCGGRKGSEER